MELTVETFAPEMAAALRNYERYVVCLDQLPEECAEFLQSLMAKAISAFNGRAPPEMRHGISVEPDDHHHPEPDRRPTPPVRDLLQSPLALFPEVRRPARGPERLERGLLEPGTTPELQQAPTRTAGLRLD